MCERRIPFVVGSWSNRFTVVPENKLFRLVRYPLSFKILATVA
ncbi:hypothetical protein PHEL85_3428 [Polaribacter sp. Hel1_85]|nr:hypothetical protein PHEL85_3428 [Polaribacter sp. Hel1_85]